MQLADLERTHGNFYVPNFAVKVGGQDLVRDLYLAVSSVTVDLKERRPGRFSLVVDSAFDWKRHEFLARREEQPIDLLELFAFGRSVEVAIGYGDPTKLKPILTGLVTEITTDFTAGSTPQLHISGSDDLYRMTIGRQNDHWDDKPDSAAVAAVARRCGLRARVEPTSPTKLRIDQVNQTDMAFVEKLAKRNGFTFYQRDGTLYFGPRNNDRQDVLELKWGEGLLSFSPEANLARQISEVRVFGRSATTGEVLMGRAKRGQESGRDTRARSGGDRQVAVLATDGVLNVRAALHTQAEADARAKAVLEERAQDFVTGSGSSVGLPEILPDTNLALSGLGRGFSKIYYVSETTHRIDRSGYNTSFKVEETTV